MKTLVLGGSIFIGLHLVRLLHSRGHDVTVLNRGHSGAGLPDGVERLTADRTDPSQVKAALKDASYDAVFDISGYTPESLEPVIEALSGRVGHFIFCSTTSVYGPSGLRPVLEDFPLDRRPEASEYARDKILAEDLLLRTCNDKKFPVTILRPPYVYGPDNKLKQREFSYFARLEQGRTIIIPGDGHTLFHPVHVDDLAEAFVLAVGRRHAIGQIYTVCGPEAITINGYVETIGEVMGISPEAVRVESGTYEAMLGHLDLANEQAIFPFEWKESGIYSIEKAGRELEWSPSYSMRDGLEMTYRWWKEQGLDKEEWDFSPEDRALEYLAANQSR